MIISNVIPIVGYQLSKFSKFTAFPLSLKVGQGSKQFEVKKVPQFALFVSRCYALFLALHGSIYLADFNVKPEVKIIIGMFSYLCIIIVGIQYPFFNQAADFAALINMQIIYEKNRSNLSKTLLITNLYKKITSFQFFQMHSSTNGPYF